MGQDRTNTTAPTDSQATESSEVTEEKVEGQKPATGSSRFFQLAGMTASVVGNYAKSRVTGLFQSKEKAEAQRQEAHRQSGIRIAETLGQLKGAVMKVGQMASMIGDILPKELVQHLSTLQNEAPPMPYSVIAEQIEKELGGPPDTLFDDFDREPFASASIGQVHRAWTQDGRDVVVKVQYPGVDAACDSDLNQLKFALRASGLIHVKKEALNDLFEEIRKRLHEELDYRTEANHARLFRDMFQQVPYVVVPHIVEERSSQRVLTLTYESGDHISRIDHNDEYTQDVRNQLGHHLMEFVVSQIFVHQTIHGDPNQANFAFRPDGSIVLYDFGCVKKLKPDIVEAYRDTIIAGINEDYEAVDRGLIALGARIPDGPPLDAEFYKPWREILFRPFLDQEFDYGKSAIHTEVVARIPDVLKRLNSFQPPPELFFLDRMILGQYETMRKLKPVGNFNQIIKKYLFQQAT